MTDTADAVFPGYSDMAARCRAFDWAATPLGPVSGWSHSLRAAAGLVLASRHPMFLWWGPELVQLYNDAYRSSLGDGEGGRHPRALGARGREFWPDIWDAIGPEIAQVMTTGEATWHEDQYLPIERNGRREDVWWTYGYSPAYDDDGSIAGTLVVCQETTARVLAERERERLRADSARAEHRAARVLAQVSDALVQVDRAFRIVDVNPAAERTLGIPRGQLVGRSHWEAFPGSVGAEPERQYRRVQAERVEAHFTHRYVDADRDFVAEVDAYPIDDGGVAIFWRDVTGRAAAERALRAANAALAAQNAQLQAQAAELAAANDALRAAADRLGESEGRLRRVAESGIVGLFFFDLAGGITEANDAFLALLGYTQADLAAGRVDWRRMTPPEYAAADAAAVAELVATGAHGQLAKEYLAKSGRRVPVVVQSALLHDGAARGVCVCLDDTGRRHAEARLGRVLAQAPAAIAVLLGPDHVVQSANETFLRLLGRRDYVGRPARETAPELVAQGFLARMDAVYGTGVPFAGREAPLVWDRDGNGVAHEGFFDFIYQPILDAAGAVEGVLVFAVEVTAQVHARRAVEGLNAELLEQVRAAEAARAAADVERARATEANAAKAQFLTTMSHELRTPLNAIAGYAELLAMGVRGPVTEAQRADLERLQRANQHLIGLVRDVLNFARIDAGRAEYQFEVVRLGPLVADLEALVGPQVAARRLVYDHDGCGPEGGPPETPDRPHRVWADAEKVRQVLLNLLGNAITFTEPGGRVSLACEHDAAAGVVRVRVSDTGRGIAADQLARVFEPFVQVDRHRTQVSQQGVGLGLAISRDLARGMGGDLTAASTPGAGSTFTLTLPAAEPSA